MTGPTPSSASRAVLVLNGPNLGRLGTREPEIYGTTTYAELAALCVAGGRELGLDVEVRQSDSEAELLGWLHEAADAHLPVVLNAGALTHTSLALADAAAMRTADLIEVHISNVHAREAFRHHSYLSAVASGVIVGLGVQGYVLALAYLASAGDGTDSAGDNTGARADSNTDGVDSENTVHTTDDPGTETASGTGSR